MQAGFLAALACVASLTASAAVSEADSRIYNLYVRGRGLRVGCATEQPGFDGKFSRVFDPWTLKHRATISAAQAELGRINNRPSAEVESEIVHKIDAAYLQAKASDRAEACAAILEAVSKAD